MESIRLTKDLIDCEGTGLVIGRSGITLDLDGHVIDGIGLDSGVLNPGFDNVTVTNGQINEFDYGVQLGAGTGRSVVSDLRVELNQEAGIALADADQLAPDGTAYGNTIRGNTLIMNKVGVAIYSGTRNAVVRHNAIGASPMDGVRLEHARGNRIEHNEVTGSGGAGVILQGGRENVMTDNLLEDNKQGVMVGEELLPSNDNLVERNTIVGHSGGISVIDSIGNDILENRIGAENGGGVTLELARDTLVRANNLAGSKEGIVLDESSNNRLEINNASGTLGTGISIGSLSPNNDLVMNTASENAGEGIEVDDAPPTGQGNLLERNDADGNGGDGIALNGVGHIVDRNSAQRNGGWGIYAAAGAIDRGGNFAAGNVEPLQCFNVVCTIGSVPGEPETWIVDAPPALSHSRNASFTYRGSDNLNFEHELVFECRIDSTDPFAWEDCEYPADITNLSPGIHTFEVRTIDLGLLADSTPAKYIWTYEPLPANDPPEVILDLVPPAETWLPDAIFTFHSDEPDVTFECKVDEFGYEPCGFEEPANQMHKGGFEWGLEETDVGPHTFSVRAIDFEGNVGDADRVHVEPAGHRHGVPARAGSRVDRLHAARDAVRSRHRRRDAQLDRGDRLRRQHGGRDVRVLARPGAVRAVHAAGHLHGPAARRPHAARHRERRRGGGAGGGGVRVGHRRGHRPPAARDHVRPSPRPEHQLHEVRVQRHRRPDAARAAHLRVPARQHERARLAGVHQPVQPARPLHLRGPGDGPGSAHLRGAGHRHVRAAVREPEQPEHRGQPRPDAGHLHVEHDGGHHAARYGDPLRPGEREQDRRRSARPRRTSRVRVLRHRQRDARARARVRVQDRRRPGAGSPASHRTTSAIWSPASTASRCAQSTWR